ncbi:toprim domain-containing protein [Rhodospira trueperi]|uniref:Toprim-like n=1 Tax=Rhodospira trueperi TaxID=69960 RepID=A0A1G7D3I8_9PROT|nr:toprim domain-containing protein [Rhodospira trueperi]SDE46061.1 Toprim-like [Rhodospira trueperi]
MRDDIAADVRKRLIHDYKMRPRGEWLQRGVCPQCGEKELYANGTEPWVIRCGRLNKCGFEASTKDLYPDAFGQLNERYPATSEKPNETAHAYMGFVRGLPDAARGWYRQGKFWHPQGDRSTATVLFEIAPGIWMERFVEPVRVKEDDGDVTLRKQHFHGAHKGLAWAPPKQRVGDELWIVEGCIDAATLACAGLSAAATLSASNYPGTFLQRLADAGQKPVLVWALDNDPAGKGAMRRHIRRAEKDGWTCRAALVPRDGRKKRDWNDLWLAGALTEDTRADTLDRCRFHGDLFRARTAKEKGLLIYRRKSASAFGLDFDSRTWWWKLDQERLNKATMEGLCREDAEDMAAECHEICNCAVSFLYFQQSKLTDESWYYTRVDLPDGRTLKNTFRGADISSASEFKKRLISIAPGALYSGSSQQLNWIVGRYLRRIRVVETVEFIGYSREHETYVFPDVAVHHGRVHRLNDEDFFEVGRLSIKSLNGSLALHIGKPTEYRHDWPDLVYRAYGAQGLIAAAFFLGSLVAEQIRAVHKSFPFLEIVGEAGAGKSSLIEFLWKLVGRVDYEGFDPNKATSAALARNFSQVSNLPISLIESDRDSPDSKQRQFDWDQMKTAYNGRAVRSRGVKNGGNETYEPPFRASVLISQNAAVNASEAILTRIVHLLFDCSGHSAEGKDAADELSALPVEHLSHWLILVCQAEDRIMETVRTRTPLHEKALLADPAIRSHRIAKNHGQMMALAEVLCDLCEIPRPRREDVLETLHTAATRRQDAIASDHAVVEEWWELVEFLDPDGDKLNHSRKPDQLLALNLNQVIQMAQQHQQVLPATSADLKRHLKTSKSRKFLGIKTVNSGQPGDFYNRAVKCWCFEQPRK